MTNKRRLGNHNVPSFKELYEYAKDEEETPDNAPPYVHDVPDYIDNISIEDIISYEKKKKAKEKFLFKLRQVIKGQLYDNSVEGGYDFVGELEGNGYKGVLHKDEDPPYFEFTQKGSPINVKFYYNTLGGISLNNVMVKDTSRDQTLLWTRSAPPQYTDTVADIRQFMKGSRGGQAMSISENDDS